MPLELDDRGHALENEYIYRRERELMEKLKAKISSENLSASAMNCPKCDGKLVETDFENIKIDVCSACTGVWLDAGELAQIAHHETENKGWFSRHFG
ncbi:MAG: zf-TFIIB domain-containing protein [Pyrinomonadaceae bacterium]|nr:zf-TFIIB domain-containing protein [Pyrinomonadaceae bacterium]